MTISVLRFLSASGKLLLIALSGLVLLLAVTKPLLENTDPFWLITGYPIALLGVTIIFATNARLRFASQSPRQKLGKQSLKTTFSHEGQRAIQQAYVDSSQYVQSHSGMLIFAKAGGVLFLIGCAALIVGLLVHTP